MKSNYDELDLQICTIYVIIKHCYKINSAFRRIYMHLQGISNVFTKTPLFLVLKFQ